MTAQSTPSPMSPVPLGTTLAGRYRVDRVIGQGGMGVVVQAMHLHLQQPVAMKLLLPEVLGNPHVVQRFLREAQAAVRLRSEHVARVIDVGTLEAGAPYMVLEYLEGADLASFPPGHLTVGGIVDLMLQACEALAEAHALGIVHRDIKPANLFLTRRADGSPLLKVLDFGISKIRTVGGGITATQAVIGTPAYMSPEQMRSSHHLDHRSDVWSLGVVLYELLQGGPPFGGDTFSSLVLKVVNDPLPRFTVALPGRLDEVVYRCLEKDPARRFQTIAALTEALARYAQSESQAMISVQRTRALADMDAARVTVVSGAEQRAIPSTISGSAGSRTTAEGARWRWPIVAAVSAVGIVVAVVLATRTGGEPRQHAGSAPPQVPGQVAPTSPAATPTSPEPSPAVTRTPPAPSPPVPAPAVKEPDAPAPNGGSAAAPAASTPSMSPAPAPAPLVEAPNPTTTPAPRSPAASAKPSPAIKKAKPATRPAVSPTTPPLRPPRSLPPEDDVLKQRK